MYQFASRYIAPAVVFFLLGGSAFGQEPQVTEIRETAPPTAPVESPGTAAAPSPPVRSFATVCSYG